MVDDAIAICLVRPIPQRMRLAGTVAEIWRPRDNGVTTLTTWPFDSRGVDFLWVVHSDHASI